MTIGEALAEARNNAGLSVDEVSERTRIRETVIRGIERDDYDACGGDLYVRGYVRVIASVVGIDAQPLIREYDLAHAEEPPPEPPTTIDPVPPGLASAGPAMPYPITSEPPTLIDSIIPGFEPVEEPVEPEPDMPESTAPGWAAHAPVTPEMITPELVASEPLTPEPPLPWVTRATRPAPASRPRSRRPRPPRSPARTRTIRKARIHSWRWVTGIAALAIVVLAGLGFAGSHVFSSLRHGPAKIAASNAAAAGRRNAAASPGAAGPGAAAKATSPAASPGPAPKPVAPPPSRRLQVALAEAFGPSGVTDGDNPQGASFPVTSGSTLPWQTDWYTTPDFGLLKQGTGLLLDMGRTVTVTSVHITLGAAAGTDLQLWAGGTPDFGGLRVVARASGAGGTVSPHLSRAVRARYVLLWFTLLPPNGTGQYQVSVYRVRVYGRS